MKTFRRMMNTSKIDHTMNNMFACFTVNETMLFETAAFCSLPQTATARQRLAAVQRRLSPAYPRVELREMHQNSVVYM